MFFLQNSLGMILFFFIFFIEPKLPYESHVSRHTYEPLKKKLLKTRPHISKNASKCTTICKIHDVDKSTLVFSFQ